MMLGTQFEEHCSPHLVTATDSSVTPQVLVSCVGSSCGHIMTIVNVLCWF